jgi:hypothetical protein
MVFFGSNTMGAKDKIMTAEGDWKEVRLLKSGTVIGNISPRSSYLAISR